MLYSLLLFCSLFSHLTATISEISSLSSFKEVLRRATPKDLIVFDIDNTLIIPKDKVLRPCGYGYFDQHFLTQDLSAHQLQFLGSKMLLEREVIHLDSASVEFIQSLQSQGIKVIALTFLFTGKFGAMDSIEDWRIQELKEMDYDFSKAFPHYPHIVFGEMKHENFYPVFKAGILFSGKRPKGEVLQAFLRRVRWSPERVFFIDDDRDFVESVHTAMGEMNVACECFHYHATGVFEEQLDEEVAKKQFDHLRNHEQWLSDAQAKAASSE